MAGLTKKFLRNQSIGVNNILRLFLKKFICKINDAYCCLHSTPLSLRAETLSKDIKNILKVDSSQHAAFLSIFNTEDGLKGLFRLTQFPSQKGQLWSDRLYGLSLDKKFSIINVKSEDVQIKNPEDPRIFFLNHVPYVYINTWDGPWIYNFITKKGIKLTIKSFAPYTLDKNWTAFVDNNCLFFIYSFEPLVILNCDIETGICDLIQGEPSKSAEGFVLRGGTGAINFENVFVGIAHSSIRTKCEIKHRPHIFVMKKNPFRIVYVGPPLSAGNYPIQDPCNLFKWEGNYCLSMTVSYGEWTYANESIAMKIAYLPDFEKFIGRVTKKYHLAIEDLTRHIKRYYGFGFFTALNRFFNICRNLF